jgi:hypothetical protein
MVIVGSFVSWFAPLELYTCDVSFGVRECYTTEDVAETTIVRLAATLASFISMGAGLALLAHWIAGYRSTGPRPRLSPATHHGDAPADRSPL